MKHKSISLLAIVILALAGCTSDYSDKATENLIAKVAGGRSTSKERRTLLRIYQNADAGNRIHFLATAYRSANGVAENWMVYVPERSSELDGLVSSLRAKGKQAYSDVYGAEFGTREQREVGDETIK